MTVQIHPGDRSGCGSYRLIFPAQACADNGCDVTIADQTTGDFRFLASVRPDGTRIVHSLDPTSIPEADTIVLQRPIIDTGWQFVRLLKKAGKRVVVDVDDDFDRLHANNPAMRQVLTDPAADPAHIHRAIAEADACTVSTEALALRYGSNGTPVTVLRNMVPAWYLTVTARRSGVGWAGNVASHNGDLAVLGGALAELQRAGTPIRVVGKATAKSLGLAAEPDVTGWVPIDQYPREVARFRAGIVPLKDTQFNQAKSWLKGLEYAALGVPFAASPTGPYCELAALGIGEVVTKPNRWRRTIEQVLSYDSDLIRRRVTQHGLTYEDRWADWWKVWAGRCGGRDRKASGQL